MLLQIIVSLLVLVLSSGDVKPDEKLIIFNIINITEQKIPILDGCINLQQTAEYFCDSKNNINLSQHHVLIIRELCSYVIKIYSNIKQFLETQEESEKVFFKEDIFINVKNFFPKFYKKINKNWGTGKEHPILIEELISIIKYLETIIGVNQMATIDCELNERIVKSMNIISDF